jgi:hypothetical protein
LVPSIRRARASPFGTWPRTKPPPSRKRGGTAGAWDRHTGSLKPIQFKGCPKRPAKDRLKESQGIPVLDKKPTPKSLKMPDKHFKKSKKALRPFKAFSPSGAIDRQLNAVIDSGEPPIQRIPKPKRDRNKIKFHKWELDSESWNFKRSPHLIRLRKNLNKVIGGRNPFYRFKDLFKRKILKPGILKRLNNLLDGGLLVTTRALGVGIKHPIRKVRKLSFQDMELLISKLPFWATSYSFTTISKIAFLMNSQVPVRPCEASLPKTDGSPPGPVNPWCVRHVPTGKAGRRSFRSS